MITLAQYFGPWLTHKDATDSAKKNAAELLKRCAALESEMVSAGVVFRVNPATQSGVSGNTFGGFRPQSCPQGAPQSAHKTGEAVDRYDPDGKIDGWLIANPDALERHNLYIEHPSATNGWSHWSTRAPKSGKRIFFP